MSKENLNFKEILSKIKRLLGYMERKRFNTYGENTSNENIRLVKIKLYGITYICPSLGISRSGKTPPLNFYGIRQRSHKEKHHVSRL